MAEFVAIGDLHLTAPKGNGKLVGGLSAYIEDHDKFVMDLVRDQPLRFAAKRGIKHIFFLGDICSLTRLSYEAQLALISVLRIKRFHFHFIPGNHDLFGADPELGHSLQIVKAMELPNVSVYEQVTDVELDSAPIRFLPWPHSKFSKSRLNIAHIDVKDARSDSGRVMEGDSLPASTATAVVGHIHTNQVVRNTWFPGTLYQTNFGESPDKFFHHIRYDDGAFEIENVKVKNVYTLHTIEVQSKKDLKSIPVSDHDLIKLILLPGCRVQAADYAHLKVHRVTATSTDKEVALARIEDLNAGSEVSISTDDFFKEWLRNSPASKELKTRAFKLRAKILGRSTKTGESSP